MDNFSRQTPTVAVVVLGELSRSPRMLNHARELRKIANPMLIGYAGGTLEIGAIQVRPLEARARAGDDRSRLAFLAISAVRMMLLLPATYGALIRSRARSIVVQNPPSFPTLLAAWLAARRMHARLIIDWHNYGYSLLALRLGPAHAIVRLSAWYEGWAGRRADGHLCVSQAMREDLARRWRICAEVLYDRPLDWEERAGERDGRLTVVCPSGWTKDERMDVMFDALDQLRGQPMRVHLTGDGPRRKMFEPRVAALRDSGMEVHTGFLSESDYRDTIRSADLGVSLHASSSGLDLAMKVVDLFAAGVPVCALDYGGTLREQIRPGENGWLFHDASSLAGVLRDCIADREKLQGIREAMRVNRGESWSEAWNRVAAPVILKD